MNITHFFFRNDPEKTAFITQDHSYSYGELYKEVYKTAAYINEKGIKKGDRILILHPVTTELYIQLLALLYIGAVPVFIDAWAGKKRILQSAGVARCTGMLGTRKLHFFSFFFSTLRNIPVKLRAGKRSDNASVINSGTHEDDPALITFTTGSTGIPKAAVRTHGILRAQLDALEKKIICKNGDSFFTNLPIVTLIALAKGYSIILPETAIPAEDLLKKYNTTSLALSPSIALHLAATASPEFRKAVKHLVTGGAAVFPADAELIKQNYPNSDSLVVYGSTEAEPVSSTTITEILNKNNETVSKGLFVGKPDPRVTVRILSGNFIPGSAPEFCKENIPGEIVVSGKHVVKEYFQNPSATTETKFTDNGELFHRTGDAGILDEKGNLYLLGRIKFSFTHNGIIYFLIPLEEEIRRLGIKSGTVLSKNDQLHIFAEQGNEELLYKWSDEKKFNATIHFIKKMPRDPRHLSRIDYEKLLKRIS